MPKAKAKSVANLDTLDQGIEALILYDWQGADREKAVLRVTLVLSGIVNRLNITGEVQVFGSFASGFKFGSSDLDVVLIGDVKTADAVPTLSSIARKVESYGFNNVTAIYQANVPLVKFTDIKSGIEVDFTINNLLGARNSLLLKSYNQCDSRVMPLGRMVKEWAKAHNLVGTSDGLLNSYAYMLLVIFFLLVINVVPNLQTMAKESHPVPGHIQSESPDTWETKFVQDVTHLPQAANDQSVGSLLFDFFHFYAQTFDWSRWAVCMRLAVPGSGPHVEKHVLLLPVSDEQWYIEDPFDLKHNLAGKCTRTGRKRIIDEMKNAAETIKHGSFLQTVCQRPVDEKYYLKCRVTKGLEPVDVLKCFMEFKLGRLFYPKTGSGHAFLEFDDVASRRRAHIRNETYLADCQLQLHYSTAPALQEAAQQVSYSEYDMASYKWQYDTLMKRKKLDEQIPESQDISVETVEGVNALDFIDFGFMNALYPHSAFPDDTGHGMMPSSLQSGGHDVPSRSNLQTATHPETVGSGTAPCSAITSAMLQDYSAAVQDYLRQNLQTSGVTPSSSTRKPVINNHKAIYDAGKVGEQMSHQGDVIRSSSSCDPAFSSCWRYVPPTSRDIRIRSEPNFEGGHDGHVVHPSEEFLVSEEKRDETSGVLYLRLADGRGWLFDMLPGIGEMCVRSPDKEDYIEYSDVLTQSSSAEWLDVVINFVGFEGKRLMTSEQEASLRKLLDVLPKQGRTTAKPVATLDFAVSAPEEPTLSIMTGDQKLKLEELHRRLSA